jgi:hypothetical protein
VDSTVTIAVNRSLSRKNVFAIEGINMNDHWKRSARPASILMLLATLAGTIVFTFIRSSPLSPAATPGAIRPAGPPILQLERIGELAPVRVHVADVLIAEGEGLRGSWLIKGDALLVCDVAKAKITSIDPEYRTATLELPPLRVTSARVDFQKTKTWNVEKTTWLPWSGGDQDVFRDAAMLHAQKLVEAAVSSEGNFAAARQQAEVVLHSLYESVDWNVTITWTP